MWLARCERGGCWGLPFAVKHARHNSVQSNRGRTSAGGARPTCGTEDQAFDAARNGSPLKGLASRALGVIASVS